ncbi:MAG: fumarylacetoacetate hydrolase family protein [Alphaproteobacteria bacterium]|nr:fumarylacetoacetate hydrolase family protein [Alphaproteobacteria bacterium]
MTKPFDAAAAAAAIAADRLARRPIALLTDGLRPPGLADGYRVQFALHEILASAGCGRRVGWKIGATTRVMQEWLAIDHPCGGGVLAGAVQRGTGRFRAADLVKPMVETEIVATLGADLPPRDAPHDVASVAPAVAALHAGIELVDSRYGDYRAHGVPTLIGDDFFQAGVVIGAPVAGWRTLDLPALAGRVAINGAVVGEGKGAAVMGHPLAALAWLADTLAGVGQRLRAGEFVFLGSVVAPQPVKAGDHVAVTFAGLGSVEADFA